MDGDADRPILSQSFGRGIPETEAGSMSPETGADLVAYYRVSTKQQGVSGLGLEAQQAAVAAHVRMTGSTLRSEYTEIESGKVTNRPQLVAALADCRVRNAILVIAKLDRLSRSVAFLAVLLDGDVELRALDMPFASRLEFHILSAIAEHEAKAISDRTTAALAAYKARGGILGRPANLTNASRRKALESRRAAIAVRHQLIIPLIRSWRTQRWTLRRMAAELARLAVQLPKGGTGWRPGQVARVMGVAGIRPRRRRGTRRSRVIVRSQDSVLRDGATCCDSPGFDDVTTELDGLLAAPEVTP